MSRLPALKIMEAEPGDAALLASLLRRSFLDVAQRFGLTPENCPRHPSNCTPDWILGDLSKGVRYFTLENASQVCGCVALEHVSDEACRLERLAVLPEYRSQGFGKALVDHVVSLSRTLGARRVELAIIAEHTDLMHWYERQGFHATDTKRFPQLPFGELCADRIGLIQC